MNIKRVNAGNRVNRALNASIRRKVILNKTREIIHNSILLPTVIYGREAWVWQKKLESNIIAMEMRSRRRIFDVIHELN